MTISRSELHRQAWFVAPPRLLAPSLGLSPRGLKKLADRLQVPFPYPGYWKAKKCREAAGEAPPPILSLKGWDGPESVTLREDFRGRDSLPVTGPNPLESGPLADALAAARQHSPRAWVAFWIEIGTRLAPMAIQALRWEHITEKTGGGWAVRGPLGRQGQMIETDIAPIAAEALRAFRRAEGTVLANWDTDRMKLLKWLIGVQDWRKRILELRSWAGAGPVRPAQASLADMERRAA